VNTHNAFNEAVNDTYTKWGTIFNYSVYHYDANMDYDAYINEIQILYDQGYEGLFMMVDDALRQRAFDLTQELKLPCVGMPTTFADSDGHVIWPSVVMDEYGNGALCVQWLTDNYSKYWKDPIDPATLGLIAIDFSPISGIHARMPGIQDAFTKNFPDSTKNFFVADLVTNSNGFSVQGANEMTAAIISSNTGITKWFVVACVDDWAVGAERAVESLHKNADVLIVSNQADAFGNELKAGSTDTSYVAACAVSTTELTGYTSAYLCAILDGRATAETIWPEYVKSGDKYPCIVVKGTMLTKDTYNDWMQKNSFETVSAGMK
jgi:ABC-type sugar transport system substrate-binding protein